MDFTNCETFENSLGNAFTVFCHNQFFKSYLANATIGPETSPARRYPQSDAVHTVIYLQSGAEWYAG